jgi:branched-chain amino acid transport system substrate-binding protein
VLTAVKNAGSVDTDKVIAALEALKYDFYKGPQYYRQCDHQSVQSVLVIKSKSKDLRNESDVFEIINTDEPGEASLRSCEELGHKA